MIFFGAMRININNTCILKFKHIARELTKCFYLEERIVCGKKNITEQHIKALPNHLSHSIIVHQI
ncbi:hypothetical protein IA64_16550 [Xanthomonas arboricola pv. celebensis]|nr:hypothetical protein IA64_16550 [Xanthomonas arboricola pv. celebensis]